VPVSKSCGAQPRVGWSPPSGILPCRPDDPGVECLGSIRRTRRGVRLWRYGWCACGLGRLNDRLAEAPVAFIPVGAPEWHGPHLPLGVDPLSAEQIAAAVCERVGGVFVADAILGTERERTPDQLESLGLPTDAYVVGMDFPANSLKSCYCPEEVFGIVIRETLRQVRELGIRLAVIVNGHGGANHERVLARLEKEFNSTTDLRCTCALLFPRSPIRREAVATPPPLRPALMMHYHSQAV